MAKWELNRERYLSLSEVKQLVKVCEGRAAADKQSGRLTWPRVWAIIHTALETGLRVSELKGINCGDIFLKSTEANLIVRRGKGGKSRRVTLSGNLRKHLQEFIKWKASTGEDISEGSPFFCSAYKERFSKRGLQVLFKKTLKASSLSEHYSIHSLRHTCGTYTYDQTRDLRYVQKLLGHSSPATTTIYAQVTPEKEAEYINTVSRLYA